MKKYTVPASWKGAMARTAYDARVAAAVALLTERISSSKDFDLEVEYVVAWYAVRESDVRFTYATGLLPSEAN